MKERARWGDLGRQKFGLGNGQYRRLLEEWPSTLVTSYQSRGTTMMRLGLAGGCGRKKSILMLIHNAWVGGKDWR
jgi:hypothetical protein